MQYTCITASERYVVLGANTGGVYCFHRDGLKYIRILAMQQGERLKHFIWCLEATMF